MPIYHFNLRDGGAGVLDQDGTELPDLGAAKAYAAQVARELMNRDEHKKRRWRLDVVDADGERVFDVPFAAVDPSLDHLEPELREVVERLREAERQLVETIFNGRLLVVWNREAPARLAGKPHLAALFGQRVPPPPVESSLTYRQRGTDCAVLR